MSGIYLIANGAMQSTAAFVPVATGTAIKTMLQVTSATKNFRIIEWGLSFDAFAAALPPRVELIETDVAATVTASVEADVTKLGVASGVQLAAAAGLTFGVSATGYTASVEGATTAVRNIDTPLFVSNTAYGFTRQLWDGQGLIQTGKFARIRITAAATVNAYCYMIIKFG